MLSSEDEDDIISSDKEDQHKAWNFFLDAVAQDEPACLWTVSLKTKS